MSHISTTSSVDAACSHVSLPAGFSEATAEVNGVTIYYVKGGTIYYVKGGTGEPLVLVHGWPQTCYEWRLVMPQLAERYTVIAPDLRGAGGSSKPPPSAGYDARTMAEDIRQLVRELGFSRIRLVGHDIGLLVAYAYAATHPAEVERLVILDGLLVGIEPMWSEFLKDSRSWVFGFPQVRELPEQLTVGRERLYLTHFLTSIAYKADALPAAAIDEYVRAYSQPGAMSAGFEWFRAFPTDIKQNLESARTKLPMPVLTLGSEKTMGRFMVPMLKAVADDVRGGSIPACGHYIAEEKPDVLLAELAKFLP